MGSCRGGCVPSFSRGCLNKLTSACDKVSPGTGSDVVGRSSRAGQSRAPPTESLSSGENPWFAAKLSGFHFTVRVGRTPHLGLLSDDTKAKQTGCLQAARETQNKSCTNQYFPPPKMASSCKRAGCGGSDSQTCYDDRALLFP